MAVTWLGFHAGFSAGAVVAMAYLIANNPRPDRASLPYARLLGFLGMPILLAAIAAPLGGALLPAWDPLDYASALQPVVSDLRIQRFLTVWGIHLGLYVGATIGAVWGYVKIRRTRIS